MTITTVSGTTGNDNISAASGDIAGTQYYYDGGATPTSDGSPNGGSDTIATGSGSDTVHIAYNNGLDSITLGSGADSILGATSSTGGITGGAKDTFNAGSGADTIDTQTGGKDVINGSQAAGASLSVYMHGDTIGNDTVNVHSNATIIGSQGNDSIVATGSINGILDGQEGSNTIDASSTTNEHLVIYAGGGSSTTAVESVSGGSFADQIVLNGHGSATVHTNLGNDTVNAIYGTNDIITGGGNNFIYSGTGGSNTITDSASGHDTISYAFATQGVDLHLTDTSGTATIGSAVDSLTSPTNVYYILTPTFNDTVALSGTHSWSLTSGGSGNDSFDASASTGSNTLTGGSGNDTLLAGSGTTYLNGNGGHDNLVGDNSGSVQTVTYFSSGLGASDSATEIGGLGTNIFESGHNDSATGNAGSISNYIWGGNNDYSAVGTASNPGVSETLTSNSSGTWTGGGADAGSTYTGINAIVLSDVSGNQVTNNTSQGVTIYDRGLNSTITGGGNDKLSFQDSTINSQGVDLNFNTGSYSGTGTNSANGLVVHGTFGEIDGSTGNDTIIGADSIAGSSTLTLYGEQGADYLDGSHMTKSNALYVNGSDTAIGGSASFINVLAGGNSITGSSTTLSYEPGNSGSITFNQATQQAAAPGTYTDSLGDTITGSFNTVNGSAIGGDNLTGGTIASGGLFNLSAYGPNDTLTGGTGGTNFFNIVDNQNGNMVINGSSGTGTVNDIDLHYLANASVSEIGDVTVNGFLHGRDVIDINPNLTGYNNFSQLSSHISGNIITFDAHDKIVVNGVAALVSSDFTFA